MSWRPDLRRHDPGPRSHLPASVFPCPDRRPEDWTARAPELVSCWLCAWEVGRPAREAQRRRQRASAVRRAKIRRPPRPPFENVAGRCSLCGGAISKGRRSWCSEDCVSLWAIATGNAYVARHFLAVDLGYRCWECGEEPGPFELEVDHRRPLWSLTAEERLELRWWLPFNLRLLCRACHLDKTAAEARERAMLRRVGAFR